jgi:hypothetical protein
MHVKKYSIRLNYEFFFYSDMYVCVVYECLHSVYTSFSKLFYFRINSNKKPTCKFQIKPLENSLFLAVLVEKKIQCLVLT